MNDQKQTDCSHYLYFVNLQSIIYYKVHSMLVYKICETCNAWKIEFFHVKWNNASKVELSNLLKNEGKKGVFRNSTRPQEINLLEWDLDLSLFPLSKDVINFAIVSRGFLLTWPPLSIRNLSKSENVSFIIKNLKKKLRKKKNKKKILQFTFC